MSDLSCEHDWKPAGASWIDNSAGQSILHQNEVCSKCQARRQVDTSIDEKYQGPVTSYGCNSLLNEPTSGRDNVAFGYVAGASSKERGLVPLLVDNPVGGGTAKVVEWQSAKNFSPEEVERRYQLFDEWLKRS